MQTEFHSYVIRMSLLCTRMLSVCHSYVVLPWTQSRVQNVFITINSYDVNCWQKKAAGKGSKKWLTFEENIKILDMKRKMKKSCRDFDKNLKLEKCNQSMWSNMMLS